MKRLLGSFLVGMFFFVIYWGGVYISGAPLIRGKEIAIHYFCSIIILCMIFVFAFICPAWDDK